MGADNVLRTSRTACSDPLDIPYSIYHRQPYHCPGLSKNQSNRDPQAHRVRGTGYYRFDFWLNKEEKCDSGLVHVMTST